MLACISVHVVRVLCACVSLVACFFVHEYCVRAYYQYCVSNIFIAYMFKGSKFCVILADTVHAIELVFGKFLI